MTQSARLTSFNRLPRLAKALGCVGSLGLLSSGMALAQSKANEVVISAPVHADTIPSETDPVVLPSSPAASGVAAPESIDPVLTPPVSIAPSKASTAKAPRPVNRDDGYDAPTSIVLTERSTGCRAVLRAGQLLDGSPCALDSRYAPKPPVTSVSLPTVSVATFGANAVRTGVMPSWQDYYKRTVWPPGVLGNGNIRLIFPLSIPAPISSLFGWRVHPITGEQRFHAGTDLAAPLGTPVLAAYAGRVAIADFLGGYGLAVALDHNKSTQQTIYGHLSEIFVKPGEWVKQGTVIGRVGSTGLSTGPHLHFEFRQLTPDGWVAMDAGAQLEYAMAELVRTMQVAQARAKATAKS